jgi:hypothetical protein
MKDVQATGEAFSPQNRTSSTSKHEISSLFSNFVGNFSPPGSGSSRPNPDLQHWKTISLLKNVYLTSL